MQTGPASFLSDVRNGILRKSSLFRRDGVESCRSFGVIHCLNAARYVFKAEPEEVTAFAIRSKDRRFKEVPEAV
jgi:hypothetical protein